MSSVLSSLESLNGLIAFASAVQAGSFSAAGRQLGLSASAVGKAVERLELRVGTRLLNRTTRSLALTDEGKVLYHYANSVLNDLREAERELGMREHTPRGHLRITAAPVLGRRYLLPALAGFHELYPDVVVNISIDSHHVDIIEAGYDLALWAGELEDSSLQARRLGSYALVTCASPAYLAQYGIPTSPADLEYHRCIYYRHTDNERLEPWRFHGKLIPKPASSNHVINDADSLVSIAIAGLAIVQVPYYMVRAEIAERRLLEVLRDQAAPTRGIFLVWPPLSAQVPRVRVVIDFITERLRPQFGAIDMPINE